MKKFKSSLGQSLVELLVAIAIAMLILPALATGLVASRSARPQTEQRLSAIALLREGQEAVRSVREKGWTAFANNGTFHPVASSNTWSLVEGEEAVDSYTRQIEISDVYRSNTSGNIISDTNGWIDPSTKKVVVSVSWDKPLPSTVSSQAYLTRFGNLTFTQTTESELNQGTKNGVVVTNTAGGEVVLGAGGGGDWCSPSQSILAQFDLPKNGVANALSAYQGRAIAGTGENASGVSLADISITDTNPPVPTIRGTFNGYKTNDVYIDGTYAYIATDDNQKEVVIVDLNTYQEVGYFNASGPSDATSVFVLGDKGYVTSGLTLYIFDLSSKSGARPLLGSYLFLGIATSVVVSGNYAFVSLSFSLIEMQIIDVSNPQSLFNAGWANVNGRDGKKVFVNPSATRAYLATNADPFFPEFFIIDITSKTGSRPIIGSYNASGMNPTGLSIVPGNKALLVGTEGEEYQVIDITQESLPSRCGGLQVDTGIKGVVGILETDGDAYSYIVTGDASLEFKIIEGGPGGQFSTEGTFESSTFDASLSAAFNIFFASVNKPPATDIKFQIGVSLANPQTSNCTGLTFTFVGPDGGGNSYYSTNSAIFVNQDGSGYENPGRCIRYKSFLSTIDPTQTPTLYDFTVNYSP